MEQESFEEFLTPITPTKSQLNVISTAPDSPTKAQARNRLGSLLGQIRKGDSSREGADQRAENADFYDEDVVGGRRGPGRPKKIRREKRVVFELRGKPFGLRDSGKPESIYALCRKWMYGKDDAADDELEALDEQPEFDVPRFKSLDLMATRDIHVLPQARPEIPLMDPRPPRVICPASVGADKVKDGGEQLLREYKHHWKDVKKNWMGHNRKRQQRYTDSLQLLRTVYGIAQQAHP